MKKTTVVIGPDGIEWDLAEGYRKFKHGFPVTEKYIPVNAYTKIVTEPRRVSEKLPKHMLKQHRVR